MEVDFKGLLRLSDLRHFSDVLTAQEMEKCTAHKNTDSLSSEIIKYLRNKPLNLLAKIPECLRTAKNDSLAAELERAYHGQPLQPKAGTPGIPVPVRKISSPVEVQDRDDEGKLAFAGPGGVYEFPGSTCGSSLYKSDSTQGNL